MKNQYLIILCAAFFIAACKKPSTQSPIPTFTITSSSGTNGAISPIGAFQVASGGSATYAITPNSGYGIATVTVDGLATSVTGSNSYLFTDVTANHTIAVTFAKAYTITVMTGPNGRSSLARTQVISGRSLAITFTPAFGYHLDTLLVDGTVEQPIYSTHTATYTLNNVTANHDLNVSFTDKIPQKQLDSLNNLLTGKWTLVGLNSKLGNLQDTFMQWDTQTLYPCSSNQYDEYYANGIYVANNNAASCNPLGPQQFKLTSPNHWELRRDGRFILMTGPHLDSLTNVTLTKDSLIAFYYGGFDRVRGISYHYHYARKH